jgi:hypothetical protein
MHGHFHASGRIAGAAYLEQVRDITPADIRDRARELGELEDFCGEDEP